ncbi:acetylxylan esterase [Cnuibacter physcomitrellae]|uniref:Acetylesterase n=1 Tax=Cnuibacter physcomitrellae TaxID=1619308 RepID=A0A1X9LRK6_9MICO|nr:acetylxylan esterase [Cnuibacter physcomitrellae]ARJ06571.1 acetylesterase [Cnuibacter physcomitrellae]GGI38317.1 acetylxylan esterase [Cnuibacter physcomitrellae]
MLTDLPLEQLWQYRSAQTTPDDFDAFWADTLTESRAAAPISIELVRVEPDLASIELYDVTFPGFAGQPIKGWLRVPAGAGGPLPAIVQYIGYGGGRGRAWENLLWASAGFVHLQMDTRGQGAAWSAGATGDDPGPAASGPQIAGVMTRGIDAPEDYYYRRLVTDAVRAIDAIRTLDVVDESRIAVLGTSQGGGLALAVAGLRDDLAAVAANVPFLSDYPRAIAITDARPYHELTEYLAVHREKAEQVLRTLSYHDAVSFSSRASAPARFSAALMDPVTPPSTVFGAFHRYAGEKEMRVWPYNGHESGQADEEAEVLAFLRARLAAGPA